MSDDPKINMITTCWRHLRLTGSPLVPKGSSPPKLPILVSTLATMYRLQADVDKLVSYDDQLAYVHNYLVINDLPRHKLKSADKARVAARKSSAKQQEINFERSKMAAIPLLIKQEKARQKEPFLACAAPPQTCSVPLKRLTKKQRRAERQRRQADKASRKGATPKVDTNDAFNAWVMSDAFLDSYEWRRLRYQAVIRGNGCCEACGARASKILSLNVDHIKPRRHYPHLALKLSNLQCTCGPCNHGKSNWDETDWRDEETKSRYVDDWEQQDNALDGTFLKAIAAE